MPLEVPSWLQPMSQGERERLALAEDQVRAKAVSTLRKQIGLARMKEQYGKLRQSGVDDLTARKTSLLENAEFLFADNPEAVVNLQKNDEALDIRARAQAQLQNYREALIDQRANAAEMADRSKRDVLDFREKAFTATQEANTAKAQLGLVKDQRDEARFQLSTHKENRLTQAEILKDEVIKDLDAQLIAAEKKLIKEKQSWNWTKGVLHSKPQDILSVISELKAQRAARVKELGGDPEAVPTPAAAAAPTEASTPSKSKRLKWTPNGFVPAE